MVTVDFGPVDYFKLFFPDNLFNLISEQTNLFAEQVFDNPLTVQVMLIIFYICSFISIFFSEQWWQGSVTLKNCYCYDNQGCHVTGHVTN